MEYRIVRAENPSSLETDVQKLLDEGWALLGGLVIEPQAFGSKLYQALTKEDKPAARKAAKAASDV